MSYRLIMQNTARVLPARIGSDRIGGIARRRYGEGVEYENGGDTAILYSADGAVIAVYEYRAPFHSTENYFNV
jgi:hypothetical protein